MDKSHLQVYQYFIELIHRKMYSLRWCLCLRIPFEVSMLRILSTGLTIFFTENGGTKCCENLQPVQLSQALLTSGSLTADVGI